MVAKIRKVDFSNKIMLDPSDFRKGIPKKPLPELTSQGLILSLTPISQSRTAKLNEEGTLKINMKYESNFLHILGRYIQVKVKQQFDEGWLGIFHGFNVKGKGRIQDKTKDEKSKKKSINKMIGCKVLKIEG